MQQYTVYYSLVSNFILLLTYEDFPDVKVFSGNRVTKIYSGLNNKSL
jgi:hypothetical protein